MAHLNRIYCQRNKKTRLASVSTSKPCHCFFCTEIDTPHQAATSIPNHPPAQVKLDGLGYDSH